METKLYPIMKSQLTKSSTNPILKNPQNFSTDPPSGPSKMLDRNINTTQTLRNLQLQWTIKAMNTPKLTLSLFTKGTLFKRKSSEESWGSKKSHGGLRKKFYPIENRSKEQ